MPTIEELQAEADRRSVELARSAKEKDEARVKEEQAHAALLEQANRERLRLIREADAASTFEHHVLTSLDSLVKSSASTADSLRQIRNAIAFVILLSVVLFVVSLVLK
jgi:hypothetical protein